MTETSFEELETHLNQFFEEYLKKFRNNTILSEKKDSEVTILTYWKNPLVCEACGKDTHMTSRINRNGCGSIPHPLCEECYKELHAYHVAVITSEKEKEK
jgi:hypothetical protein